MIHIKQKIVSVVLGKKLNFGTHVFLKMIKSIVSILREKTKVPAYLDFTIGSYNDNLNEFAIGLL